MDRLTILLTLCLLPGICSTVDAQTLQLTVAGDVQEPATLELEGAAAAQAIHVRDLLVDAGIQGDGSAVVLRADSHQSGGSEFISIDSEMRGSQLSHGDIVVFHQTMGNPQADGHVVVIVDRTPRIVQLSSISGRLGNLLGALNLIFNAADQVPVVRTQRGAPALRYVVPGESLSHGDVILLNQVASVDPAHVSRVFVHASSTSTIPIHTAAEERVIETPAEPIPASTLTLPEVDAAVQEPMADEAGLPSMAATAVTAAVDSQIAESPTSAATAIDPAAVTPMPAAEAVSPIWNGVFLCGLFGSLTLIVTGWLKSRREQKEHMKQQEELAETAPSLRMPQEIPPPPPSIDTSWRTVHEIPSSTFTTGDLTAAEMAMPEPDLSGIAAGRTSTARKSTADTSDRLVKEQEWIGGDWRQQNASDRMPAANIDQLTASTTAVPSPAAVPPEPAVEEVPQEPVVEVVPEPPESPLQAADVLEDLIQNRIPMELQQADLPLRVTLFGRPAGPRRLRIDAAHTQIAPPKFAAGNRARRDSSAGAGTVPAATSSDADEAASLDRALNSLHGQDHG